MASGAAAPASGCFWGVNPWMCRNGFPGVFPSLGMAWGVARGTIPSQIQPKLPLFHFSLICPFPVAPAPDGKVPPTITSCRECSPWKAPIPPQNELPFFPKPPWVSPWKWDGVVRIICGGLGFGTGFPWASPAPWLPLTRPAMPRFWGC